MLVIFPVFLEILKSDEAVIFFVEESVSCAGQAGPDRQAGDLLEKRFRVMAFLETVVGNTGAQVVDVVETDIAGEPLENFGKFVERAPFEGCRCEVPLTFTGPVNILELVLHIEHPDACGGGDQADTEL